MPKLACLPNTDFLNKVPCQMTKRVARGPQVNYCNPKIGTWVTFEKKQSRRWRCVTFVVSTRVTVASPAQPAQPSPAQPSPAQPSLLLQCNRCVRLLAAFMLLFNTFMCAASCIQIQRVNRFKVFYSSEIMKHKYIVYRHKTLGHVTKV